MLQERKVILCGLKEALHPCEKTLPEKLMCKRQQKQPGSGEGLFLSQEARSKGRERCGHILAARCPATSESSPELSLPQIGRSQVLPLPWAGENHFCKETQLRSSV